MPIPPKVVARRRIAEHFLDAGAVSPKTAISFEADGFHQQRALEQLEEHGAVHATGDGRFYLDEAAYREFRAELRQRAGLLIAVGVAIGVALGLLA